MKFLLIFAGAVSLFAVPSLAQMYPPGTFRIDGIPVSCGGVVTVINNNIPDIAKSDLKGHIYINALALSQAPTVLRLWAYAHECGHYQMGANETAADCWAIRTGRKQGWFKDDDFPELEAAFANNPGDLSHPPGPARVQNMKKCFYGSSKASDNRPNHADADESTTDDLDMGKPAGDFCQTLHKFIDNESSGFIHLRALKIDDNLWRSTLRLPNADSCLVSNNVQCSFEHNSIREVGEKIAPCLDSSVWTIRVSDIAARFFVKALKPRERTYIMVDKLKDGSTVFNIEPPGQD